MKTVQELRDERVAKLDEAKGLRAKANEEDRDLTTEEVEQFDSLMSQVDSLGADIERGARVEVVDAEMAQTTRRRTNTATAGESYTATLPATVAGWRGKGCHVRRVCLAAQWMNACGVWVLRAACRRVWALTADSPFPQPSVR